MSNNRIEWLVCQTDLPLLTRRCLSCASALFRTTGKFRVNANHKLLDVWLLALCTGCDETIKLTVLERANVRTIEPSTLSRLHDNDPALAAELLHDPALLRRNRISLDWDGAWRLKSAPAQLRASEVVEISVRFAQRIPLRRTRLIAEGLATSRSAVHRLIDDGDLTSAHSLTGKSSTDFSFTLGRWEKGGSILQ